MINNLQVKNFLSRVMGGSYVKVMSTIPSYPRLNARTAVVLAKTANYTVTDANLNSPSIFTNLGAAGTVVLTLPAVKPSAGKVIRVAALAAQIIRLLPQTGEAVNLDGSAVVTKYLNIPAVIGNTVELFCDGLQWVVTSANGVITKEA